MKKNYVSNSQSSVRMFKSDFFEVLSKVHYLVPVIIFLPVILFCAYWSLFNVEMSFLNFIGYFLLGLFVWTLTEYVMHRFVFHYAPPDKPWAQRLHFIFHGVHHDYPNDSKRLVMAPAISIGLAVIFYYSYYFLFGAAYVLSLIHI